MAGDARDRPSWFRRALDALPWSGASSSAEARDARFRVLYDRFREILILNDATLQLIADLEDALSGRSPFALEVMTQRVRKAALDVFVMVKNLNQITGGRHLDLYEAIRRINASLEAELAIQQRPSAGPVTIGLDDLRTSHAPLVGMKMATLGEIKSVVGMPVPEGFVIAAAAFDLFMSHNELWETAGRLESILEAHGSRSLAGACKQVQLAILSAPVPDTLAAQILGAFDALAGAPDLRVAMRSSAVGEDSASSHAGQYHTELQVQRDALLQAYRAVVASAYSTGAVAYRFERGMTSAEARMAVGCMRMVAPRCSGILFSRAFECPQEDRVVISATRGLAASVASGEQSADEILVVNGCAPPTAGGCIRRDDIEQLARIARKLEEFFGQPQDVEWAIDEDGKLFVLQSRPMVVAEAPSASVIDVAHGEIPIATGGLVACPGAGAGPVVVVRSDEDLDHFPADAVLVAHHSSPAFSRVMQRCSAIVTEVGSPTGHMAILAREFDVPAIVGLPGALALLSDGQTVTVDATGCRVFAGRLALPHASSPRRAPNAASPAVQALRRAADLVTPLYLTDPLSIEFIPRRCRSLHDITRFVHEKVFEAMFHFGDVAADDRERAIALDAHLPIRVALYDLGGGLHPETLASGRATPDQVTSVPARAFLEGMLDPRIRWDQPRPVSTRGFLSVLGEGIAGLPAEAQQVGRTSYAVVSDRYMNFSTKAGYHFSTIDTWCGESINKNYIHFRFERGGAGGERRARRVQFLDTVLSRLDFVTQRRGDTLVARLQKYQRPLIVERLAALGRLTLVARQLDMVMDTDASAEYFASAFLADKLESF